MGETCGLKLVYETKTESDVCKLCHDVEKKQRRYDKMHRDVLRWQREGGRPATVERTCGEMEEVMGQIYRLNEEHNQRLQSLGQVRRDIGMIYCYETKEKPETDQIYCSDKTNASGLQDAQRSASCTWAVHCWNTYDHVLEVSTILGLEGHTVGFR